jgi:diguanylate cyclase
MANAAAWGQQRRAEDNLYARIGGFLVEQRLEPNPANYAFAYHLLADPAGPLAKAVAALTDDGVRLTQRDVEKLNCDLVPVANTATAVTAAAQAPANGEKVEGLVAQTQMQVEGFADMMSAVRAETAGFGRDLAASAEALSRSQDRAGASPLLEEVAGITAAMLARVRTAEQRLELATREANDLREKLEEARDNARRDPLTTLANRRAFEEAYAAQVAAGAPICLAVCDVDHFKSVNDRFGHVVGDRVLKAIAEALTESCPGQLVARYGGEEFVVLFSGVALARAEAIMEEARATVAAKRYRLRETDAPLGAVTFSAGLTAAGDDPYHAVFRRADALLYAAKEGGRNRVHLG